MIVWAWLLISAAGSIVALVSLVDAVRDYRGLGDIRNGRRILAIREIRVEASRLAIQSSFAFLGGLAVLAGATGEVNIGSLILVGANALLLANSALDLRDRLKLRRLIG